MKFILIFLIFINLYAKNFEIKNCQYYDEFFNKCLFYEKSYFNNEQVCIEKCQFWDETFKKCLYKSKCQRVKNGFIEIKCEKFDNFFNKCLLEEKNYLINEDKEINININIK